MIKIKLKMKLKINKSQKNCLERFRYENSKRRENSSSGYL
jgi:hypothetical protein